MSSKRKRANDTPKSGKKQRAYNETVSDDYGQEEEEEQHFQSFEEGSPSSSFSSGYGSVYMPHKPSNDPPNYSYSSSHSSLSGENQYPYKFSEQNDSCHAEDISKSSSCDDRSSFSYDHQASDQECSPDPQQTKTDIFGQAQYSSIAQKMMVSVDRLLL